MFTTDNINARLARLLQVAALSFCMAVPQVVSAQRHDNADALQITIMRQQREIDSLRAELSRYSSSVASNWDLLSGIEPDDETRIKAVDSGQLTVAGGRLTVES